MNSITKVHPDFPSYKISQEGKVFSLFSNKELKLAKNKDGYSMVELKGLYGRKRVFLHRLVMETFIGKDSREVNHLDKERTNNSLSNLEYCNRMENTLHTHSGRKRFVTFEKRTRKWSVRIRRKDFDSYFGHYDSEEAAYSAAFEAHKKFFGVEPWRINA